MSQSSIHDQKILILDFGSQYTRLIARRVREAGVYCEIQDPAIDRAAFDAFAPDGVIFTGGPESAAAGAAPRPPEFLYEAGVPVLGICYGMQIMAERFGGRVEAADRSEFGHARVTVAAGSRLLGGLADGADGGAAAADGDGAVPGKRMLMDGAIDTTTAPPGKSMLLDGMVDAPASGGAALLDDAPDGPGPEEMDVWMSHGDRVAAPPPGFAAVAATGNAPVAAMEHGELPLYGLQFHPEVTHTPLGRRIIERFVRGICGCDGRWTPAGIVEDAVAAVREKVGRNRVLLGLSGGVDSAVTAALLHRAIGDRLVCVFVDNGLLRLGEGDQVMAAFAEGMGVRVVRADAEERFLQRLEGVADPEEKRRRIGNAFIEVFEEEAGKLGDVRWLAQGTIYPDVIESAGGAGKARVIKSHHNVGGLPEKMNLKLVEPLRELFKDEVRKIGLELGLPAGMVGRHPFPGPGLGVRVLGEVRKEYCEVLRRADAIFIEELRRAGVYDRVSQAFAVFMPVKSVGVTGDARRYAWVIALRAVETVDFMTARWARLDPELLETVSGRIMNEAPEVSRVVYDVSSKPPATIEWE